MKVFLDENFNISSIDDSVNEKIVRASDGFNSLKVYMPTTLFESYSSVAAYYSVRRADNRELGAFTMNESLASSEIETNYTGFKGTMTARELSVKGALEITFAFALNSSIRKTVAKVTINVVDGVWVDDGDVFILNDENGSVYTSLKQQVESFASSLAAKAALNDSSQSIIAGSVSATSIIKDGEAVATENYVSNAISNAGHVKTSDIVDNLTSEATNKPLSAKQGKVLKGYIDGLEANKVNTSDVVNNLTDTSTTKPLSAYQGKVLKDLINGINTLLTSNDTNLDTIQEIVTYIKENKGLIDNITTNKVNVSDIIDNLTSQIANKPLSAKQGYVLKGYIDTINNTLSNATGKLAGISAGANKVEASNTNGNIKIDNVETNVYTLPNATTTTKGGVVVGNNINVSNGTISVSDASADTKGVMSTTHYSYLENLRTMVLEVNANDKTGVAEIITALNTFVYNINDELGEITGSGSSTMASRITQIEQDLGALETAWTQFTTGTSADNIVNTLSEIQDALTIINTDIAALQEELQNETITSSGEAYQVDTPVESWGTIDKIGGMSYKCKNLLSEAVERGSIASNTGADLEGGNSRVRTKYISIAPNTTYTLSLNNSNILIMELYYYDNSGNFISPYVYVNSTSNYTFTSVSGAYKIRFLFKNTTNAEISDLSIFNNLMLNSGSTALPYEEYFSGIRNSAVTSYDSQNANLIDISAITDNAFIASASGELMLGYNIACSTDYIEVVGGSKVYFSGMTTLNVGNTGAMYDSAKNYVGAITNDIDIQPLTIPSGVKYIRLSIWKNNWTDYKKAMLNKGSTALTYVPYTKDNHPINASIQALTDYGCGISQNVCNHIDFAKKKYIRMVIRYTFTGDEAYSYQETGHRVIVSLPLTELGVVGTTIGKSDTDLNFVTNNYDANGIYIATSSTYQQIFIGYGGVITDNASAKAYLVGKTIVYPLATPIETDISAYLDDTIVKFYKNGSVTFNSSYKYDVPYQFTYASTLRDLIMLNYENDKKQQSEIEALETKMSTAQSDIDDLEEDVSGFSNQLTSGNGVHTNLDNIYHSAADSSPRFFSLTQDTSVTYSGITISSAKAVVNGKVLKIIVDIYFPSEITTTYQPFVGLYDAEGYQWFSDWITNNFIRRRTKAVFWQLTTESSEYAIDLYKDSNVLKMSFSSGDGQHTIAAGTSACIEFEYILD